MPDIIPAGTIKQFLIVHGWTRDADCGCAHNMEVYINALYPKLQIWVSNIMEIMQIREKSDGKDTFLRSHSDARYYEQEYFKWIK